MTSEIAAYGHPVDALREDHRRAISLIRLLTEQIDGLARLRPLDIEIAHGVFSYMIEFVDRQHHTREDALIELIGQKRPAAWRGIRQANQEHDQLAQHGEEVLATLKKLMKRPGVGGTALARRIRHYGEVLRKHFEYEEARLFGLAQTLLDPSDWRQIETSGTGQRDPLFGAEVEAGYQALFELYVNKVYEIGTPSSRHATASAAAIVDAAAAAVSGSRALVGAVRQGVSGLRDANRAGAKTLVSSRSLSAGLDNALKWSRSSFGETHAMSGKVVDTLHETLREVVAPLGAALDTRVRDFGRGHRRDRSKTSLRAQLVNLALRATVKRITSSGDFEIPTKNIEIPRQTIDRFIPGLAKDVAVRRVELDSAFAEVIQVKGAPVTRTILYFPGGGFMMAPTQAHRLMAARLARAARARVVLVHYRLAPEYRFPAGLDDCVEAYRYILAEGTPPKSMVLVGDSAGGSMTLSSLLRIRDEGLPLPAAAVMLSPVTDLSYSGDSRRHNSWTDPSLANDDGNLIAQVYLGADTAKDHPLASPLFGDLSGLPPVLIQVGSIEILLDDALRVAAKIRAQGGQCECEVWHDMPHDWMLIGMLPEARKALRRIVEFIDDKFVDHAPEEPMIELERQ
ncbi:MAG: alpha/beta hydrolase fold domain-containing protein [Novosphingobium sp.]